MRRLVIVFVVLILLLVAADRLAWKLAEGEIATRIQAAESLAQKPDVDIHGFPFLTQVFGGVYTGVDAALEDLKVDEGAEVDQVKIDLEGLHVPLSAITGGDLRTVPVDRATATGLVSYSSLDAAAAARFTGTGLAVHFAQGQAGTGNQVALSGTYSVGGLEVQLSGDAAISAEGGELVVSIPLGSLDAPAAVRSQVARLLGTSYHLPDLPLGLKVSKVSVGSTGVAVTATGSGLSLGAAALSQPR